MSGTRCVDAGQCVPGPDVGAERVDHPAGIRRREAGTGFGQGDQDVHTQACASTAARERAHGFHNWGQREREQALPTATDITEMGIDARYQWFSVLPTE